MLNLLQIQIINVGVLLVSFVHLRASCDSEILFQLHRIIHNFLSYSDKNNEHTGKQERENVTFCGINKTRFA
jgi:hypothetical protein